MPTKAELETQLEGLTKENQSLTEQLAQRNETVAVLWLSDREGTITEGVNPKGEEFIAVQMTKSYRFTTGKNIGKRAYGPSKRIVFNGDNIQRVKDILASDCRLCSVEYYEAPFIDGDGRTYKSNYNGVVINALPKPPAVTESSVVEPVAEPANA